MDTLAKSKKLERSTVVSGGDHTDLALEEKLRYFLLNFIIFMGLALLSVFGIESFMAGVIIQGIADFALAAVLLVSFVFLNILRRFTIAGYLALLAGGLLFLWLAYTGGINNSGILWSYSYPIFTIFILGRGGMWISAFYFTSFSAILLVPGFSAQHQALGYTSRSIGVYLLVFLCTIVYEQARLAKERSVFSLTKSLQAEKDEISAMKDNLEDAIFMLDVDLVIQPQYSQTMEKILGRNDLAGKRFTHILEGSLTAREIDTLGDYFQMVHKGSFDKAMLSDINPLQDFAYMLPESKEERHLACMFTRLVREENTTFILGTLRDQTREWHLQLQLKEEELKRADEMKALFEIIHVEPKVLNDFIDDAEHEFERINGTLKDRNKNSQEAMVEIYQSIHAIKSNAVILGLDSLGAKVHQLEHEISVLRDKSMVDFQDTLRITLGIERIQKEKDRLKELIGKIVSFRYGQGRMQEEFVLVRTLEKIIAKVGSDHGKSATLLVDRIDAKAVDGPNRRLIKEILVQMVRNAMYHGIEKPDLRASRGKTPGGNLRLSIELVNKKIQIKLADDGNGLDFSAIKKKALEKGLIQDEAKLQDRNTLLQVLFSPGFSTAGSADMHAGRGIGLSLVRERVREVGGNIRIQSEDGKGLVFNITLPASEEQDLNEEELAQSSSA